MKTEELSMPQYSSLCRVNTLCWDQWIVHPSFVFYTLFSEHIMNSTLLWSTKCKSWFSRRMAAIRLKKQQCGGCQQPSSSSLYVSKRTRIHQCIPRNNPKLISASFKTIPNSQEHSSKPSKLISASFENFQTNHSLETFQVCLLFLSKHACRGTSTDDECKHTRIIIISQSSTAGDDQQRTTTIIPHFFNVVEK